MRGVLAIAAGACAPTGSLLPSDTGAGTVVHVETSGPRACADPALRDAAPFTLTYGAVGRAEPIFRGDGAGVAVADFDGDGRDDVLIVGYEGAELYLQDAAGAFAYQGDAWFEPGLDLTRGFGGVAADYDADGDQDVFLTRYAEPNVLLRNEGGTFHDAGRELGLQGGDQHASASATWSDFDGDGDLDLYVAGHGHLIEGPPTELLGPGHEDYLYANRGDGTFEDVSDRLPQRVHDGWGFVPLFVDLDDDGWRDLFLANDLGVTQTPCLLVWNREGTFVLDDNAAGLDLPVPGMGIGLGDVDRDGLWDLLVPAWAVTPFMYGTDAGVWVDHSAAVGVVPAIGADQVVGWGAELQDFDNDARLDAFVVFGYGNTETGTNSHEQPNGLWMQQTDGNFVQSAVEWGVAHTGSGRGVVATDLDDDGWVDLVVPDLGGPALFYRSRCGAEGWLSVRLGQPGTPNPDAIGAVVEVEHDGVVQRRAVLAGGTGYGSGGPPEVHFGLAGAEQVERIVVTWPDGTITTTGPVAARQSVRLVRESGTIGE